MDDHERPPAAPLPTDGTVDAPRPSPNDVGPIAAVDLLIDEARAAVAQEISMVKALAAAGAATGRTVAILGVVAILTLLVAIMALALGMLFALATELGFVAATAIVVGALLAVAAVLALLIRRQIARFRAAARGDRP